MKNVSKLFALATLIAFVMTGGGLAAQSAAFPLDGVWQANNGHTVAINGSAAVSIQLSSSALWRDAVSKGFVKVGDQVLRNIVKRPADLQWSCQELSIEFRSFAPTVATGARWEDRTITMNANGQSIQVGSTTYYRSNSEPPAAPSIDGVWEAVWGHTIFINGSAAVYTDISVQTRWQDAILKGYIHVGGQKLRNLARTGDLTWAGQDLDLEYNPSIPDVPTGVIWRDCTISISADGQSLTIFAPGKDTPAVPYSRKK